MSATITYCLTAAGQKASILTGGDGKMQQTVTVERDAAEFPRVVTRGTIANDGKITLTISSWQKVFDAPQTAASILDALDAADAQKMAEEATRKEALRAATLKALEERPTYKHSDEFGIDRAGQYTTVLGNSVVKGRLEYETANWPYPCDQEIKNSPEGQAWEAELLVAKEANFQKALEEARAKLPAVLEAERIATEAKEAKAAKLKALKEGMGGQEDDYLCRIEDGALANVPCWESHNRGKNWMATIAVQESAPGGLARDFIDKARGDGFYLTPALAIGDAVEFGADYYSGRGRKTAERWYGFVVAVTETAVLLRQAASGKAACKAGAKFREKQGAKS